MKRLLLCLLFLAPSGVLLAEEVASSQTPYLARYASHESIVPPAEAPLNTEPEPDLEAGFVELYNGRNLDGWVARGGYSTFEAVGDRIVGTCVPGSPNTFLCTVREDFGDFIFTVDLRWVVDSNSGVMVRAQRRPGGDFETIYGPQVEMEGFGQDRGWSGGIYGEQWGGWRYPLWLESHADARAALREGEWNRLTIKAVGPTIQTWINGVPAAHWVDETFTAGFFGLQVHSGRQGEIHFRHPRVRELPASEPSVETPAAR